MQMILNLDDSSTDTWISTLYLYVAKKKQREKSVQGYLES